MKIQARILCWSWVLLLLGPGCHPGERARAAEQEARAQAQRQEAGRGVEELSRRVQEESGRWRDQVATQRRERDRLMLLSGNGGLGLAQKRVQGLARDAGLERISLRLGEPVHAGTLVSNHPVRVKAEGSWNQALQFLARGEAAAPELGVMDFRLRQLRAGPTSMEDRIELEARVAIFIREVAPPPPAVLPPQAEVPSDPADATRLLTERLLLVQGARAASEQSSARLREVLGQLERQSLPVRRLFAPLPRLLSGVWLLGLAATSTEAELEGRAPDRAAVERFRTALAEAHDLLAPGQPTLEHRPGLPGQAIWFRLPCARKDQPDPLASPTPGAVGSPAPSSAPPGPAVSPAPRPAAAVIDGPFPTLAPRPVSEPPASQPAAAPAPIPELAPPAPAPAPGLAPLAPTTSPATTSPPAIVEPEPTPPETTSAPALPHP